MISSGVVASGDGASTTLIFDKYLNDFEGATDVSDPVHGWSSNTFFGAYTVATFARTTTNPKTGSYSLEITWPTATDSRVNTSSLASFVVGEWYTVEADVWVDTGGPDVNLDPFLQTGGTGLVVNTTKNAWVHMYTFFQAVNTSITFALKTASACTSGQKTYLDNVHVTGWS